MAKSRDKGGREAKKPKADKKVAAPPGGFPRTQPAPATPPKAKPAK
jgi:hypothetical protein